MTEQELIQKTIARKSNNPNGLAYINIDNENKYRGWVADFGFRRKGDTENIKLNLHKEYDLFLLFFMASVWSRPGPFENAAFLIGALVGNNKIDDSIVNVVVRIRENFDINQFEGRLVNELRKKFSVRNDVIDSLKVLLKNWNDIYKKLNENHTERDWRQFAVYMNSIQGLGYGNKAMLIKIPLILRELRCQKVFDNIPGKYCCVADSRVKEAFKIITCKNFYTSNIDNVLKASEKIYADYGDLYDIPLFAYKDLM